TMLARTARAVGITAAAELPFRAVDADAVALALALGGAMHTRVHPADAGAAVVALLRGLDRPIAAYCPAPSRRRSRDRAAAVERVVDGLHDQRNVDRFAGRNAVRASGRLGRAERDIDEDDDPGDGHVAATTAVAGTHGARPLRPDGDGRGNHHNRHRARGAAIPP